MRCVFLPLQIVSHIDTAEAIHCYDEILEVSDAVMISRPYLGMRIPAAKVRENAAYTRALIAG